MYLALDRDWSVEDAMHAKYGRLWWIDDWCAHHVAEDATIADCECTTVHIFNS